MRAEILESSTPFQVQPALRQDGTTGPPLTLSISMRPCWRKPAVRLELEFQYESGGVAFYVVARDSTVAMPQ
jgi:hypothetical protein